MKITETEMKVLLDTFNVIEDKQGYDLESWTDGGVDMIINLPKDTEKSLITLLKDFIQSFDIDEEIDIYRQDEEYRNHFTIRDSITDFEDWVSSVENVIETLENMVSEEEEEDIEEEEYTKEPLKGIAVKDTEQGLTIILFNMENEEIAKYNVIVNIKNYNEGELFDICSKVSYSIQSLYYELTDIPTQEEILDIVRKTMIK